MANMLNNNNPLLNNIMNMLQKGGNNPQAFAQNILKNNPEFAKQLQGQNLQSLAMNMLQSKGINPQMLQNMIGSLQ